MGPGVAILADGSAAAATDVGNTQRFGTIGRQQAGAGMGRIRIGIGGWNFPEWRGGTFYPADLRQHQELEYASSKLTTIEINATYYGSQKPESFQKWHDETPDDFVFAVKASRFATSRKVLAEANESVTRFLESGITRLGAKLGPINWQLAESKKFDAEDFAAFLTLLPDEQDGQRLRHAVEARHTSFNDPQAADLCRARNIALIRSGDSEFPDIDTEAADFAYLRIMGTTDIEGGYDSAGLDHWTAEARRMAETRDLYLYVIAGAKHRNPACALASTGRLAEALGINLITSAKTPANMATPKMIVTSALAEIHLTAMPPITAGRRPPPTAPGRTASAPAAGRSLNARGPQKSC